MRRRISPPKATQQRVMAGDSSARRPSVEAKSYEPEGVRRVSGGMTHLNTGAQPMACPFPQGGCVMRHDSFGPSRFGSFCGGMGSMGPMGFQNAFPGSMYGLMGSAYGSMGPGRIPSMGGSFMFRGMDGRMPGYMSDVYSSAYGSFRFSNNVSMYPMQNGSFMGSLNGSFYGPRGVGSIMNASLYDNSYMNNSFYKAPISGQTSSYGLAAQWSSLADMSGLNRQNELATSDYGGFQSGSHYRFDDLYPKYEQDTSVIVKRSGRRGGKNVSSETKNENPEKKSINTEINIKQTSLSENKQSESLPIKQKIEVSNPPTKANEVSNKARAAVPTSYDVHTLLIVDKCASGKPDIVVTDPNTVVLQKNGRSETFECDEALHRAKTSEEVDSVLFSDLRSNWLAGHCSSILCCAGKGKDKDAIGIVHTMVKRSLERLEKAPITTFDVSINMCQLRGANQGLDLFNDTTNYENLKLGSHPVYGPCLLGLTTKVVRTAKDCVNALEEGIAKAQRMDEITTAFLVLKTARKSSSSIDVFLSSLCIVYMHETPRHITELKDKASMSPHRIFRYAVGGACVCVSMVVLDEKDTDALACLEAERKVREVKNKPPRSGNVRRFIEFTDKEIVRQKEKLSSSSGTELSQREMQIKRMEDMLEDARSVLNDPAHSQVKGYILS
ncbi:unnamed protein product [Phytomonas sp. EM1]|nr:unnamed protein product [Phytomonas sp. EM1]|eukprot:CCW63692.1 unnamed protein product [Phytomonas sp. isolate EM1]